MTLYNNLLSRMLPTRTSLKLVSLVATSMPVGSNGAGGRDSLSLEHAEAGKNFGKVGEIVNCTIVQVPVDQLCASNDVNHGPVPLTDYYNVDMSGEQVMDSSERLVVRIR